MARRKHRHDALSLIVAYSPTEVSASSEKDAFYEQLDSLVASVSPHDQLFILGDLNASSDTDRTGFESVIGNYGSGYMNDNSLHMISLCSSHNLSIIGSWFRRRDIHIFTWLSHDAYTRK